MSLNASPPQMQGFDASFLEATDERAVAEAAARPHVVASALDTLNFSDLYVNLTDRHDPPFFRIGPNVDGKSGLYLVPAKYASQIEYLRTQIDKHDSVGGSGILSFDTMRLRFQRAQTADGAVRAAVRRIPIELPRLDGLLMSDGGVKALRQWGRSRGIVLIGGATGAGKTTTAVGILVDYLNAHGGKALTIEDPPEYLMQGWIGDNQGHCDQIEIAGDGEWEGAVDTALRWRPRFILIGEIRSPEAAAQALRASTSGHLVITTVHGGSVDETVGTLLRLAEVKIGDGARRLLAHNLAGVVHQKLGRYGPDLQVLAIPVGNQTPEEAQMRKYLLDNNLAALRNHAQAHTAERPGAAS